MPLPRTLLLAALLLAPATLSRADDTKRPDTLPDTKALAMKGDIAEQLVAGVDKFLLREIESSAKKRESFYKRDYTSHARYNASLEPNRRRLAHILGMRDAKVSYKSPEYVSTTDEPSLVGKGANYEIHVVRWPAFGDVHGEGLLLTPAKGGPVADVVAVPDADHTPEQLCGLTPGVPAGAQFARRLAESGCRVLVPVLIDRTHEARNGRAKMTSREFIYRSAFELGRHVIGYEVQKILAGVDWFAREGGAKAKIGVYGYGEGGMLALYAGALDTRITTVAVSGYFGNRNNLWQEPIERNVFGLLEQFGDAELAAMVLPRTLLVEHARAPEKTFPSEGGAPGKIVTPTSAEVKAEFEKAEALIKKIKGEGGYKLAIKTQEETKDGLDSSKALTYFLEHLAKAKLAEDGKAPTHLRKGFDAKVRQQRQLKELDRHNQQLLEESPYVREKFMGRLKTTSLKEYEKSVEEYREHFAKEIIGRFDHKLLPANARTKKFQESEKWTIYQVVLDVYEDVIAYGLLVIPNDLKEGEKRPVVVCQHGLEGKPEDCIGEKGYAYYKAFATKLAERGFVTFAPQNLYIGKDKFRTLQRKANPIKKTLFSVIVPQHQQITDWLKTLPFVDGSRIGFYGLSYGGKTAMRVPPLVSNYALSICSADYNDWVWKNASSRAPYSYVWTGEYEIFEFDLGSTFNYSEMAALIAPRPFMVERGHFDGVAPDERVALEYAKVRLLYQGKLKIGDRTVIEWFDGPHTINGKGTFEFLQKHLKWPEPK
jgi:dienelactone hydrolase